MARIEKTVFISYRRKDISWALAVYQYLTSHKYDVFFDFSSIPSGDFEQIIVSNIRARAHFVLILTPTALDRAGEAGDWLRREIETAVDERRNIIPLFFDGFNFGSPSVAEKLTGKLSTIPRYNGLDIPAGYFMEAMERLRNRYLNVPLNAVIHPIPTEVQKVVKEEQVAADKALVQKQDIIQELVRPVEEKPEQALAKKEKEPHSLSRRWFRSDVTWSPYSLGAGILFLALLSVLGIRSMVNNSRIEETPSPTQLREVVEVTQTPTKSIQPSTASVPPFTSTPVLGIGSTVTGNDDMTLLYVPAGNFIMGREGGVVEENPAHTVYLDSFWIDQTEVTNAMFASFLSAAGNQSEGGTTWLDTSESDVRIRLNGNKWQVDPGYEDHPATAVSWYGAKTYCEFWERRLPTEAEWEKAARGTDAISYPWGDTFDGNLVNSCDANCSFDWKDDSFNDGYAETSPVGNYPNGASPYGVLDMAGNVWEWVSDWYDASYYVSSPSLNPQGPASGSFRVLRGGAWNYIYFGVSSTFRVKQSPVAADAFIGFRCAMSDSE